MQRASASLHRAGVQLIYSEKDQTGRGSELLAALTINLMLICTARTVHPPANVLKRPKKKEQKRCRRQIHIVGGGLGGGGSWAFKKSCANNVNILFLLKVNQDGVATCKKKKKRNSPTLEWPLLARVQLLKWVGATCASWIIRKERNKHFDALVWTVASNLFSPELNCFNTARSPLKRSAIHQRLEFKSRGKVDFQMRNSEMQHF